MTRRRLPPPTTDLPLLGHAVGFRAPGGRVAIGATLPLEDVLRAVERYRMGYGPRAAYWVTPVYDWAALIAPKLPR